MSCLSRQNIYIVYIGDILGHLSRQGGKGKLWFRCHIDPSPLELPRNLHLYKLDSVCFGNFITSYCHVTEAISSQTFLNFRRISDLQVDTLCLFCYCKEEAEPQAKLRNTFSSILFWNCSDLLWVRRDIPRITLKHRNEHSSSIFSKTFPHLFPETCAEAIRAELHNVTDMADISV